ncbi:serine protease 38, partial [Trichonephila clavata]
NLLDDGTLKLEHEEVVYAKQVLVNDCSHSNSSGPSTLKKPINMTLPALIDERAFFGLWDEGCHPSMLMLLIELEQQRKYDSGGKNGKSFDNRQMQEHPNNTNYLQGEVENNQESSCKKCGKSKIDKGGKIIHGEVIPLNKYPWIVPVIAEAGARVKSCGGAVISKQYVLTAAHCIFYDLKANMSICQGPGIPEECFVKPENSYIKLLGKEKLGKEVRIKRFIPHPEFINKPEQVTSDVALLELAETLQCGEMTSPICVANNEELYKKNQKIFVAGWGQHELKRKCKYLITTLKVSDWLRQL